MSFVAARQRDCIALVGCTLDSYVFPIAIFEPGERVEPREVEAAIRECFKTYDVRELICQEDAWTWVLLEMESEQLPVVKMPLSPQRLGKPWQVFSDTVMSTASRTRATRRSPDTSPTSRSALIGAASGPNSNSRLPVRS